MTFGNVKQNITVLAASNLIIGLIEFVFNMYLSRILGAEGLGLLSLVAPVNALLLSFMTEGIVVTMSKISAKHNHFGRYEAMDKTVKVATVGQLFLVSAFSRRHLAYSRPHCVGVSGRPAAGLPYSGNLPPYDAHVCFQYRKRAFWVLQK